MKRVQPYSAEMRAFSLIELLAVMAIITLLSALALPGFNSIGTSLKLGGSARGLEEALGNARKEAISGNRVVEFRFRTEPGNTSYTTYDARIFDEYGKNSVSFIKAVRLAEGFSFAEDSRSTLIKDRSSETSSLPSGGSVTCRSFLFYPDGSTDLPLATNWYVTLIHFTALNAATNSPNVASIRIDPLTGNVVSYRP